MLTSAELAAATPALARIKDASLTNLPRSGPGSGVNRKLQEPDLSIARAVI